ncbi:hypothetical protein [Caballeronia sp. SBC2]|uniref:hypothetical protein n=1 Tax=Caballeronia sp. SBC2 TaxID=2705547 RepID=UPI0013EDAA2E|nr:hypothetical protein [Caballeronia sp. SBC2]
MKIVIGEHPAQPLITVEVVKSTAEYKSAKPLEFTHGPISRLSTMLQAAPSILVAGKASGKRLMEVVVSGDLAAAADGNGLRGFTIGAGGIKEHARLFEVSNLQTMINAAAIWQVASVVVAQKHLADISQKLDEIKEAVHGISQFLNGQRKARIEATYDYLVQAYQAIRAGELPNSVRNQLEACERDLLEIQHQLHKEYLDKAERRVMHKETAGTGDLAADIGIKIDELDELTRDMALCLKTRIAAWHVLSLYPGEPQLKLARRASIQKSVDAFQSLAQFLTNQINLDISGVKSWVNFNSTLDERKARLAEKCKATGRELSEKVYQGRTSLERSEGLLLADGQPTRIFLEFESGTVVGARQVV